MRPDMRSKPHPPASVHCSAKSSAALQRTCGAGASVSPGWCCSYAATSTNDNVTCAVFAISSDLRSKAVTTRSIGTTTLEVAVLPATLGLPNARSTTAGVGGGGGALTHFPNESQVLPSPHASSG